MEILNKSTNVSHCLIVNNQQLQKYEKSGNESNAGTDISKQMLLDIKVTLRIIMCFYLLRKSLYNATCLIISYFLFHEKSLYKNRLQIPAALLPSAYRRLTIQFGKSVNNWLYLHFCYPILTAPSAVCNWQFRIYAWLTHNYEVITTTDWPILWCMGFL